jgi:hypothetical protein
MSCFQGIGWCQASENLVLTIPAPRSELDISHDYHKTLLRMALTAGNPSRQVQLQERPFLTEGRVIAEIQKHGLTDVYWLGADNALDSSLTAIRVPTTKGLIGYRKFIIHKDLQTRFDKVQDLASLQNLIACQGEQWPDTRILRNARFKVTTARLYEDLFKMLAAKRCDYFPRGLHDHTKELELRKDSYPQFVSYQDIMLYYPFGVFFHVAKQAEQLSAELEKGMQRLARQGEIRKLMEQHALTRHLFPLDAGANIRFFSLENTYISSDVDTKDPDLWLQPEDFGISKP